MKILTPCVGI